MEANTTFEQRQTMVKIWILFHKEFNCSQCIQSDYSKYNIHPILTFQGSLIYIVASVDDPT